MRAGLGLLSAIFLLGANSAYALAWQLTPFADLSESYTDNVEPLGAEKKDEYITQISPGIVLERDGRQLDFSLDYRWQGLFYRNEVDRNVSYYQVRSDIDAIVVSDLLFLDGYYSHRQMITDPQVQVGQSNLLIIGGRQDLETSHISPYAQTRLGKLAETEVRYWRDEVKYSEEPSNNSVSQNWSLNLANIDVGRPWSWNMYYASSVVDYEDASRSNIESKSTSLNLGYIISSKFSFSGTLGYEKNEYERSIQTDEPEGEYWNVGVSWAPSPRTTLQLSGGERYFGKDWMLSISQRGRRSSITGKYKSGLSSRTQYLLENSGIYTPYDEVFISTSGTLEFAYKTRKSDMLLSFLREKREYQESVFDQNVFTKKFLVNWKMGRKTTMNFSVLSTDNDTNGQPRVKSVVAATSMSAALGRSIKGAFDIQRTKYESDNPDNYTENQATIRMSFSW